MAFSVFRDAQVRHGGSEKDGMETTADEEMVYMEYLEALAAVACYKNLNPYVTLEKKLESFLVETLFPPQKKIALKPLKSKSGKNRNK